MMALVALLGLLASSAFSRATQTHREGHPAELGPSSSRSDTATAPAVVHAVMFWMEGCGQCEEVINSVLPPLQSSYGQQLQILLMQLTDQASVDCFFQAADELSVAKEKVAVPFLIVGRSALIGSGEIPDQFPGIIDAGLAAGGIDFPELTCLADLAPARADADGVAQQTAMASAAPSPTPLPVGGDTSASSSLGFAVAWAVMVLLAASVLYTLYAFLGGPLPGIAASAGGRTWPVPLLIGIGLIIAGYLSYVELARVEAFCGPIGDCNAVQSSRYGKLFGVIPMGLFGLAGYLAMLAGWGWPRFRHDALARIMPLLVFAAALFGVLFSIYLTYVEIFVLHAVCAWCLANAIVMPLLLFITTPAALHALEGAEPPD
ncbi:MAG: hypothetical protein A2Z30_07965 [Chloroflexi bacterium RBG_16_64_43]|nr:MAG: hypothetical protein A2Z30_07965 [Chloroflexi bacterium RBG_16_64_43]